MEETIIPVSSITPSEDNEYTLTNIISYPPEEPAENIEENRDI